MTTTATTAITPHDGHAAEVAGLETVAASSPVQAVDRLDMNSVETEQRIAVGARAEGRARDSAPRTMVRHVEVLGWRSGWRYRFSGLRRLPAELVRLASPLLDAGRTLYRDSIA